MTRRNSRTGIPVAIAATMPLFLVRLGVTFVRMKAKRRGAVRQFRRALLREGMSPRMADRLASEYAALGRLRTYLSRGWRLSFPINR